MDQADDRVPVVVLTALDLEFDAVRRHLADVRLITHRTGTSFWIGQLPGSALPVALLITGHGNVPAAVLAERAISLFRPRVLFFVGVAGAFKRDIALGDVVVATRVYAYHGAREEAGQSLARPQAFEAPHELLGLARRVSASTSWVVEGSDGSGRPPTVHFKPIAAGEVVLDSVSGPLAEQLRQHYNDAAAIEMESAGAVTAAHLNHGLPMLVVRGISDRTDGNKRTADAGGGQILAASNAAAFAMAVIRSWITTGPEPDTELGPVPNQAFLPAPAVVYNTLPPDTAAFTGRAEQISRITEQAVPSDGGGIVTIHAIDGMPGVGKTALAVHIAHSLVGRFPDRQLFVDLHAHTHDQQPSDPAVVLAGLLIGDNLDPRHLPDGLEARSALWRTRMASRRALLILDNAASSSQVTPLLPGSGACLVLITSRRHLGDLSAATSEVWLDVLPSEQAVQMFVRMAPRAADQLDEVAQLVALAGHLPLAITLLARVYTRHRSWNLPDLIRETEARLLTLTAENRTVAAAFDLSYRELTARQRRFFRLLGLHPGADFDPYAAAALTDTSLGWATRHLDALHANHLLTEPKRGRYGMHDLIRAYAHDLAIATDPVDRRDAALSRLLDYYQHSAGQAEDRIARYTRPTAPEPADLVPAHVPVFADAETARDWLRTERPGLEACLDYAATRGWASRVVALTAGIAELLRLDGAWPRAKALHVAAASAAEELGDRLGQAGAVCDLGLMHWLTGDYQAAVSALDQARRLYGETGNELGQANVLMGAAVAAMIGDPTAATAAVDQSLRLYRSLDDRRGEANALAAHGALLYLSGNLPGANGAFDRSQEIYRLLGDRLGEANARNDQGAVLAVSGDHAGAAAAHTEALNLYQVLGDRLGQANALTGLAIVRRMTGDLRGAAEAHAQALRLQQDFGDRPGQARTLAGLGAVLTLTGDYSGAADANIQAQNLYRVLGDRLGLGNALTGLGIVRRMTGDVTGATAAHTKALELHRDLGDKLGEARALTGLGAANSSEGDYPAALEAYEQALAVFRELNSRANEAWALNQYAEALAAMGDAAGAREIYQNALTISRKIQQFDEVAIALEGLGGCFARAGRFDQAVAHLNQAMEIFGRLDMRPGHERVQVRLTRINQSLRDRRDAVSGGGIVELW